MLQAVYIPYIYIEPDISQIFRGSKDWQYLETGRPTAYKVVYSSPVGKTETQKTFRWSVHWYQYRKSKHNVVREINAEISKQLRSGLFQFVCIQWIESLTDSN